MHPPNNDNVLSGNEFISYTHQQLSVKKVRKYVVQYDGIDMVALIGADCDNIPVLVGGNDGLPYGLWFVTPRNILEYTDEDPVRAYAILRYLLEQNCPRFESYDDMEAWAKRRDWSRKPDVEADFSSESQS